MEISFPYYDTDLAPFYSRFWATFAHFDGVHYLRLAAHGYADWGSQAFFPLYPLLIRLLSPLTPSPLEAGLLISWTSLFIAILGLKKLFPQRPQLFWLLLMFPTAFFFAMVYTESLFLMLSIWFFVFLNQKRWYAAATLAGLASGTRLIGAVLAVSLLIELYSSHPKLKYFIPYTIYFILALSGFLAYAYYLYLSVGDPWLFFHIQPVFGGGRSGSELILLPQVLYRYARIFLTVDFHSYIFQRALIELGIFVWALKMIIVRFKSYPLSQSLYVLLALIIPTFSGSLSSLPRYVLVLVPWLIPVGRASVVIYAIVGLILGFYLFTRFAGGVFVS